MASMNDEKRGESSRSVSFESSSTPTTPPTPPPDFNPPADISTFSIEHTISAISPPVLEPITEQGLEFSRLSSPRFASRPALQELRRDSGISSSSPYGSQSSGISLGSASDGGEHLVEARNDLLTGSGHGSREESEGEDELEVNVISATPPLQPAPNRRSSSGEEAWDSVWPSPDTVRSPTSIDAHARFPVLAPYSPFVTPSFSPLVFPLAPVARTTSTLGPIRRSSSPSRQVESRPSPHTAHSETFATELTLGRRRSNTGAEKPPLSLPSISASNITISKHQRSFSSSSELSPSARAAFRGGSPPLSPRRSDRPDSPARRQRKNGTRLSDLTSPPTRPRGNSFNSAGPSRISPDPPPDDDIPPIESEIPPPIATSPLLLLRDDGINQIPETISRSPASPLFAPLARPGHLRRALSDYETTRRSSTSTTRPSLAEMDKTLRRSGSAGSNEDWKGSPDLTPVPPLEEPAPMVLGDVPIVDEGDLLPEQDLFVDITFEDEGLNTLERIFLLSKSDFAFHRAYIARVLGDLLYDVDPCESVEYVLPLISSFTLDEDEGVREAFAQDLHRIIWYFYSVCRIAPPGTEAAADIGWEIGEGVETGEEGEAESRGDEGVESHGEEGGSRWDHSRQLRRDDSDQTVTVTSEGLEVVDRPTPEEIDAAPFVPSPPSLALESGPESDSSTPSRSTLTAFDSEGGTGGTSVSGASFDKIIPEPSQPIVEGPILDRPTLPVDFFTPLLGSLLLNVNTMISESVRVGLVYLVARLKGKEKEEWPIDRWGTIERQPIDKLSFGSQNGPHCHEFSPIPSEERDMLERELLEGIVIGMGGLSTEMPDYDEMTLEDSQAVLDNYARSEPRSSLGSSSSEKEAFQFQLIAEATAGRATSMNLIGSLCDFYTGQEAVEWGFVEEVLACQDGDVAVRAEGAVALSMLAKIAPAEHVGSLIPLFEVLANDEMAQVRQSACLSLPSLCRRIESSDDRRAFAISAMHSLTTFNADVRCAALEILGELIYVFAEDPQGPPKELMQVFLDEEDVRRGFGEDWDTVASFNFPGVALTLGPDNWSDIQPLYHRMNDRAGEKSRRTLAASLHELAKILTPEQCAQDLMPVYRTLLTAPDDIRELIFEHIDVFLENLPLPLAWSTYLELARSWKENTLGGWRAREQLALHIPAFFKTFHSLMGNEILGMLKDALLDPFAAVRDAATKGIPEAYEILGDESGVATRFRDGLLDLGRSSRFRERQTFVRCLREFVKPPPNRQAFEDFFLPFLSSLSKDVVDVRLGLAQTIADLFVVGAFYADKLHAPKAIYDLAHLLAKDEAVDVRDTVKFVNLDYFETNDTVPYEIKVPEKAQRGVMPSDLVPDHAPDKPSPDPNTSPRSVKSHLPPSPAHSARSTKSSTQSRTHKIRIDRHPSPDSFMTRTRLDPNLLTPTTPGTPARIRPRREGQYYSTPSPNEPPGGMDPFSVSFAAATPEGSPAVSARGLESPV